MILNVFTILQSMKIIWIWRWFYSDEEKEDRTKKTYKMTQSRMVTQKIQITVGFLNVIVFRLGS